MHPEAEAVLELMRRVYADQPRLRPLLSRAMRLIAAAYADDPDAHPNRCRRCGGPIPNYTFGRPRVLCEVCSPPKRKSPRKVTMSP